MVQGAFGPVHAASICTVLYLQTSTYIHAADTHTARHATHGRMAMQRDCASYLLPHTCCMQIAQKADLSRLEKLEQQVRRGCLTG